MKKKFPVKDIIYILIIIILLVLLIISKIDFRINMLNRDNWVDIIIGTITFLGSSILSILIIKQGYKLDEKNEKVETEIFNKQIDLDLRERRLNVYSAFMSLGVTNIINSENYIIVNFIGEFHQKNEMKINEIVSKEKEITTALCESELIFKDNEELLNKLEDIFNAFIEYRQELQNYLGEKIYIANEEAIQMLNNDGLNIKTKWIPKELIDTDKSKFIKCKEIFGKYYENAREKEQKLAYLITDESLMKLFDKSININKIGGVKDETKVQTSTISR